MTVTVPIPSALMLAPREMLAWTTAPVIGKDDHGGLWRIAVGLVRMPTDVAAAHNRRRRADRREGQGASAQHCTKSGFPQ